MSQDLFAAFGVPDQASNVAWETQKGSNPGSSSFFDNHATSQPDWSSTQVSTLDTSQSATPYETAEDDWGDFEAADEQKPPASVNVSRYQYGLEELGSPKPDTASTGHVQSSNFDLLGFGENFGHLPKPNGQKDVTPSKDPNVLFDANDGVSDDDFGEFEGTKPGQVKVGAPKLPDIDLLGLEEEAVTQPVPQGHMQRSEVSNSRAPGMRLHSKIPLKQPAQVQSTEEITKAVEEEPWDDFSAWEENAAQIGHDTKALESSAPTKELNLLQGTEDPPNLIEDSLMPTNIPPPAIIISIFPELFERVENELLKPLASQSQAIRTQVYSDLRTTTYLKGYMLILTVCARVIAGRKHRWKRDNILAQSMRIGSASAGRVTGMKVTSVDKTEVTKEDGEVAEVLRTWKLQAGRFKAAVGEAKKAYPDALGPVPELRDTIPVKATKEVDGGVPSVRPCALCGLKREERVTKVDFEVNDSFGEWWIEKTNMHRACRNFWAEHEAALRQR